MDSSIYLQPPASRSPRAGSYDLNRTESRDPPELNLTPSQPSSSLAQVESSPVSEIAGQLDRVLPLCNRSDNSDANVESPWSRKIVLALDGGGVRGYSSLLILKRLFFLISQIEKGQREGYSTNYEVPFGEEPTLTNQEQNQSSEEYPWLVSSSELMRVLSERPTAVEDENDDIGQISASVDETFSNAANVSQFKPHHYFDYIAGTSTGGLSAIMLSRMEIDVDKALEQYDMVGDQVFAKPRLLHASIKGANAIRPKYPSRYMEKAIQRVIDQCLEHELKLHGTSSQDVAFASNLARCRAIIVAFGPADDRNFVKHEYLFRTYDHPYPSPFSKTTKNERHCNPGPANREPIWKVARATSAAPLYFSTMSIGNRKFRDGGMVANNPAELACEEVDQMHEQRLRLVISIGTGEPESEAAESTSQRYFSYIKDGFNTVRAMKNLLTQSQRTHERVDGRLEKEKVDYHRLNARNGMKDIPLDEWRVKNGTNKTKETLLNLTMQYLKDPETHKSLLQCARKLVAVRRHRAATERWESFATNYVYYCHEKECTSTFPTREGFRNHAYDAHGFAWETHVCNHHSLQWACFWDQCQHSGVYVFDAREKYLAHLKKEHHVENGPKFANRLELEHWLDRGRKKPDEAIKNREDAKKRRTMTMPDSREKLPPRAKGNSVSETASGS